MADHGKLDIGSSCIYDFLAGVPALQLGFDPVTLNVEHFQLILSLKLIS